MKEELASYDLLFSFWRLLGQEETLAAGLALSNTTIPFYLSNAIWYPTVDQLDTIASYYKAKHLPPALIISNQMRAKLEPTLNQHKFTYERSFHLRKALNTGVKNNIVEQVSWSQMRYAADLLAEHYEQPELQLGLSKQLSKLLQEHPRVSSYLSYSPNPAGVMIVFESSRYLTAMLLVDSDGALESRLCFEAEIHQKQALILEEKANPPLKGQRSSVERWSIAEKKDTSNQGSF